MINMEQGKFMRIGFDATAIPANRTGAGNYIFNLVRGLASVDTQNEYAIFAKQTHIHEFGIDQPNFHFIAVDHRTRPLRLLWEQIVLPLRARQLRLDVLHSPHYTMPMLKSSPAVVTFCDMTFQLLPEMHGRIKRVFFNRMMRWSARHADRLIAISESTREDVIRLLQLKPEQIVSTPLAASAHYRPLPTEQVASICSRYDLKPNSYLCYVGVLEPRKNIPTLIEAYAQVITKFPDVPLVIAGKKGWMYDEVFQRVTELGLREHVRFLGYVPDEDLPALYNGARVFVYPSSYEGFGLPVLEALQCGTPVVTTNVSSMPEVAGEAALLVPPRDSHALAEMLCAALADDELAQTLSQAATARATAFSWERCARETLAVYNAV